MKAGNRDCDVLVIGAGPAGIAAACSAASRGRRVLLVDDNPAAGGQIWRGETPRKATQWLGRLDELGVEVLTGTQVVDVPDAGLILAGDEEPLLIRYRQLVAATGARELLLPFPGWTLPGVTGAGGLQALVKGGWPIEGKRVAVAGAGPLLLAVAGFLQRRGARVGVVAEQTSTGKLAGFASSLAGTPAKLWEGARLRWRLRGVPYVTSCWPESVEPRGPRLAVQFHGWRETECDYLACGFGLVPNLELPLLLGCDIEGGFVRVDEFQQACPEVFCAGEITGIGGADASLVEGRIAGYAAAGDHARARRLFGWRARTRRFAQRLAEAFALREELRELPDPRTIVCRCEDVPAGRLEGCTSRREAKLHTRCGMGLCQGRTCGPATRFLYGWKNDTARPPVFPAAAGVLARPQRQTGPRVQPV